jgi:hypothetical protein
VRTRTPPRIVAAALLLLAAGCAGPPPGPSRPAKPIPGLDPRLDLSVHDAASLVPRGRDAVPMTISLDGEVVWRGEERRTEFRPSAFVVRLPRPLPGSGRIRIRVEAGDLDLETSIDAEEGRHLVLLCLGSRPAVAAHWAEDPRAE